MRRPRTRTISNHKSLRRPKAGWSPCARVCTHAPHRQCPEKHCQIRPFQRRGCDPTQAGGAFLRDTETLCYIPLLSLIVRRLQLELRQERRQNKRFRGKRAITREARPFKSPFNSSSRPSGRCLIVCPQIKHTEPSTTTIVTLLLSHQNSRVEKRDHV